MSLPVMARIRDVVEESRRVRTFVLDAKVEADPGQFVMVWLPGVDEKPMSIANPDPLTITVARIGPFTTSLHQARVGSMVGIRGPYGRGFSLYRDRPMLLVAGGCGVAPLYFLALRAVEAGLLPTVAVGARSGGEMLYAARFQALGVRLLLATDDGSLGHKGPVTDLARREAEGSPALYACGPELMLVALLDLCRERGLAGQFSVERYMKCGVGICGHCALDGLLVCQDGPVFSVEQLEAVRDLGRFRRNPTGRRLPVVAG